ncbi:Haloacid dehalogenase-like hydrolase domain-containing protein Sgpp [Arachis hypogaea]|nr:Haloacid dehalogenase-like hydrolase domain-containing protein Sgpp [Arachis hypogaea]
MTVSSESKNSLTQLAPLEAVLFDIDGTLCDSDPLHYYAFREMLKEIGFNGGVPITEEFFIETVAGKHNDDIALALFPGDLERGLKFVDDKEDMFRKLAKEQVKPLNGLDKVREWIESHGLKRAAVTNAPRANAELMISLLGLSDFFHAVIIGGECEHAKPHPDPYLKGLEALKASKDHSFVFEDSVSGIKAGVAAGMPVVGLATRNPEHLLMEAKPAFLIKDYADPKLWEALEELDKAGTKKGSLAKLAPLEAVLFDVDGTLCDSDLLHYYAFREMLQERNSSENISGTHDEDAALFLFPDDRERGLKFVEDKEAMFRKWAKDQLKPLNGLDKVIKWVEDRSLKRAAVTNAPRPNAELMISKLGLSDFFDAVIIGSECEHGKPHPDPYLKGLEALKASKDHTFIFEDSVSGIKAGVAAGMPVIGITNRNAEHLLMEAKPTFLIKDYDDPKLWAALDELDKAGAR